MAYIGTGLALCIASQCTNHTGPSPVYRHFRLIIVVCVRLHYLAPYQAFTLPGQFASWNESANRTLANLLPGEYPLVLLLPGHFAPWPFCSLELSLPGSFAPEGQKIKITIYSEKIRPKKWNHAMPNCVTVQNNLKTCSEKSDVKTIHCAR